MDTWFTSSFFRNEAQIIAVFSHFFAFLTPHNGKAALFTGNIFTGYIPFPITVCEAVLIKIERAYQISTLKFKGSHILTTKTSSLRTPSEFGLELPYSLEFGFFLFLCLKSKNWVQGEGTPF